MGVLPTQRPDGPSDLSMNRWRVALQLSASGLDRSIASALLYSALSKEQSKAEAIDTPQGKEIGFLQRRPGTDVHVHT